MYSFEIQFENFTHMEIRDKIYKFVREYAWKKVKKMAGEQIDDKSSTSSKKSKNTDSSSEDSDDDQNEFENAIDSLRATLSQPFENFDEENKFYWNQMINRDEVLVTVPEKLEKLKTITPKQTLDFFEEHFINKPKISEIHICNKGTEAKNLERLQGLKNGNNHIATTIKEVRSIFFN